jgi:hypothetical protein
MYMDARNKINHLNRGRINPTASVRVGSGNTEAVCKKKKAFRRAANAAAEAVFRVFLGFFKVVVLVKKV